MFRRLEYMRVGNQREDDQRLDSDIDYTRILYSSSFRRLQGIMQLLIPGQARFHRNRLTHSLEVAQISRSIAKRLGMMDTLNVQSCALAHDLGNPPIKTDGLAKVNKVCSIDGSGRNRLELRVTK